MDILYEDQYLLVVIKPACLHSAGLPSKENDSLASKLRSYLPDLENASEKPEDCGLIHRLDYETSGLLLVAKTRGVWDALREDLKNGSIKKSYIAVLDGNLSSTKEIENYIGNRYRNSKKVQIYEKDAPKRSLHAASIFKPLKFNSSLSISIVEVFASPARRHQVRAHAAHLGLPLIGDSLYGSKRNLPNFVESLPSFILHAFKIEFVHPFTKEHMYFDAPDPTYLGQLR